MPLWYQNIKRPALFWDPFACGEKERFASQKTCNDLFMIQKVAASISDYIYYWIILVVINLKTSHWVAQQCPTTLDPYALYLLSNASHSDAQFFKQTCVKFWIS